MTLQEFYVSKRWRLVRAQAIERATNERGFVVDEITGQEIFRKNDIIVHHVIELTEDNVNDISISLNLENLKVVSFKTHNELHGRYKANAPKRVIWIWGRPFTDKLSFVEQNKNLDDVVLNIALLRKAVTLSDFNNRNTNPVIFALRDSLFDCIYTRLGRWATAWIVSDYVDIRIANRLGAEVLEVSDSLEVCIERGGAQGKEFIDEWEKKEKLF